MRRVHLFLSFLLRTIILLLIGALITSALSYALPFLLNYLQAGPGHWPLALRIAGAVATVVGCILYHIGHTVRVNEGDLGLAVRLGVDHRLLPPGYHYLGFLEEGGGLVSTALHPGSTMKLTVFSKDGVQVSLIGRYRWRVSDCYKYWYENDRSRLVGETRRDYRTNDLYYDRGQLDAYSERALAAVASQLEIEQILTQPELVLSLLVAHLQTVDSGPPGVRIESFESVQASVSADTIQGLRRILAESGQGIAAASFEAKLAVCAEAEITNKDKAGLQFLIQRAEAGTPRAVVQIGRPSAEA